MPENPYQPPKEVKRQVGARRFSLVWRALPLLIVLAMGAFDLGVYLTRGYQPETDDLIPGVTKWTVSVVGFLLFTSLACLFLYWTRPASEKAALLQPDERRR